MYDLIFRQHHFVSINAFVCYNVCSIAFTLICIHLNCFWIFIIWAFGSLFSFLFSNFLTLSFFFFVLFWKSFSYPTSYPKGWIESVKGAINAWEKNNPVPLIYNTADLIKYLVPSFASIRALFQCTICAVFQLCRFMRISQDSTRKAN